MLDDARRGTLQGMVRTGARLSDAVAEWLRYCEHERACKRSTLTECHHTAERILPDLGDPPLEDVTPALLERWKRTLTGSNRTITKYLVTLHGIFRRAMRVWGLPRNPVADVEGPRYRVSDDLDAFSPEEVHALVRAAGVHSGMFDAKFLDRHHGSDQARFVTVTDTTQSTEGIWMILGGGGAYSPQRPTDRRSRLMSRFTRMLPLTVLLVVALSSATAASASTSTSVTFHIRGCATALATDRPFSGRTHGSFRAVGAVVVHSGTFEDKFFFDNNTLRIRRTLTTETGSITMRVQGHFVVVTDTTETLEGSWTILGGSGAYSSLRGSGSLTAIVDRVTHCPTEEDSGSAHFN